MDNIWMLVMIVVEMVKMVIWSEITSEWKSVPLIWQWILMTRCTTVDHWLLWHTSERAQHKVLLKMNFYESYIETARQKRFQCQCVNISRWLNFSIFVKNVTQICQLTWMCHEQLSSHIFLKNARTFISMFGFLRMAYLPDWTFQTCCCHFLSNIYKCVCTWRQKKLWEKMLFFPAWPKKQEQHQKLNWNGNESKIMQRKKINLHTKHFKQYAGCFWKLLKNLWWQDFCEWFIFLLDAFYPLWRFLAKKSRQ